MSCVTCEPKSTMRILSWDTIAGCTASTAPRRQRHPPPRHKHRAQEKKGAIARHVDQIGRLFHGKLRVAREKRLHPIAVFLRQDRTGDKGDPAAGLDQRSRPFERFVLLLYAFGERA